MPRSYPVEIRRQVVELARAGTRGNGGCAAAAGPGLTAAFAVQRSDASIGAVGGRLGCHSGVYH